MGRIFTEYVDAEVVYVCSKCTTHLADHESLISKVRRGRGWGLARRAHRPRSLIHPHGVQAFQGRHGRAYLFADVYGREQGGWGGRAVLASAPLGTPRCSHRACQ